MELNYAVMSKKELTLELQRVLTAESNTVTINDFFKDLKDTIDSTFNILNWIQTRRMEKEMKRVQKKDKLGRELRGVNGRW